MASAVATAEAPVNQATEEVAVEITPGRVLHDADRGRIALSYGNPVICMNWVQRIIETYGDLIENITDNLTMFEENPAGGMTNPLADVSVLVAKLERYGGTIGA